MGLVDANIVLRYLLDDHAELSPKAADILERQSVTLDFVNNLLWAYQTIEEQEIFTFDGKLLKQLQSTAG